METLLTLLNSLSKWINNNLTGVTGGSGASNEAILQIVENHFTNSYNKLTDVIGTGVISTLSNSIVAIAMLLMLVYFSIDLISKINSVNFTLEIFIRSFGRLIIGYVLIHYMPTIADKIIEFGNLLVSDVAAAYKGTGSISYGLSSYEAILDYLEKNDIQLSAMQMMNLAGKCAAQLLLNIVINIAVICIAYSRAIKLTVYKVFMPMMVTDLFGTGITGEPMKHVKKYISVVLQYPLCYIIALLSAVLMDSIDLTTGNWLAYMGQMMMIMYAVFKVMKSSANEAEEIFGGR